MSAKKRKSATPWSVCDNCNVIIAQKDELIHTENCSSNFQNWNHSFILYETLHTTFNAFEVEGKNLETISLEDRNDFVLVPCHVLQLCKIAMGATVLIKIEGGIKFVKRAWPKQEKTPDFVCGLSTEVAELYNLSPKSRAVVSKVEEKLLPAKTVNLTCVNDINESHRRNSFFRLQKQCLNKIYCSGNKILIRYYGRKIVYEIQEIVPFKEDESGTSSFYLITVETMWKLKDFNEKKIRKNLIDNLGGLNSIIAELKDVISLALSKDKFLSGLYINKGILIHGPAGTGKSTLIEALAEHFASNVIKVECSKIFSKFIGETEKELENLFKKAEQIRPSIILIDDLDVLCGKSNSVSEYEKRIIATLSSQMDKLNFSSNTSTIVLAATSRIHLINKMLRCPNRFGKEIEIYVPDSHQRFEILKILLADINHNLNDNSMESIAHSSHGFVGADLVSLVSKAIFRNHKINQGKEKVSLQDFQWALNKVKPSALKEIMIEVPNVRWNDIGGQEELKLKLKQCIEWPLKYKEAFTRLSISPPKGVLMFGPPGCSKTMIAKALATESKLNFISVKGPELFSKWVGESEKAVRKVFRRARQTAPSIIFFDELDAIGGERNISTGSNVQERVLAQLLTELDGVESLDNVTVIAATNRLDRIDPALIRPGRLDRIIYVPLPDLKTRDEIFRLQLNKSCIDKDVMVEELVKKTDGYSGAEIIAVCREAALKALERNINSEAVIRIDFLEALNIVLPRTSKNLLKLYDKYLLK